MAKRTELGHLERFFELAYFLIIFFVWAPRNHNRLRLGHPNHDLASKLIISHNYVNNMWDQLLDKKFCIFTTPFGDIFRRKILTSLIKTRIQISRPVYKVDFRVSCPKKSGHDGWIFTLYSGRETILALIWGTQKTNLRILWLFHTIMWNNCSAHIVPKI